MLLLESNHFLFGLTSIMASKFGVFDCVGKLYLRPVPPCTTRSSVCKIKLKCQYSWTATLTFLCSAVLDDLLHVFLIRLSLLLSCCDRQSLQGESQMPIAYTVSTLLSTGCSSSSHADCTLKKQQIDVCDVQSTKGTTPHYTTLLRALLPLKVSVRPSNCVYTHNAHNNELVHAS